MVSDIQKESDLINEYIDSYELRTDEGDYTPNEFELLLLTDFAYGLQHELQQAEPQPDTAEPVAWVSPLLYGSQVTFPKPVKPHDWDDSDLDLDWYCYPLYTHPPAQPNTVAVERDEFEKWAADEGYSLECFVEAGEIEYIDHDTESEWRVWQERDLLDQEK